MKSNLTLVAVAFLAGSAIVYAQIRQTPSVQLNTEKTASTSQTQPSDASAPDPSSPAAQASDDSGSGTTGSAPGSTSDTSSVTAGQAQGEDVAPAPVVAVGAALGDWQDGSTTVFTGGTYFTPQTQRCLYSYSDGSQQQILYATRNHWADDSVTSLAVVGTCDLDSAPTAQ